MATNHDPVVAPLFQIACPSPSRRRFLTGIGAAALCCGGIGAVGEATAAAVMPSVRRLALANLHTGEAVNVVLQERGAFDNGALNEINAVLRDHRTGEVAAINPKLLVLLSDLRRALGSERPFQVISGYRSPKTNAMLAARSGGVAKQSFHMLGMAIDCYLPDVPLKLLHRAVLKARRGGVGLYARTGFVHIDVGPVRSW